MATRQVILPLHGAIVGDGSDGSNTPPAPRRRKGSAGSIRPYYFEWLFDAASSEYLVWQFLMPADWLSGGTLTGKFSMVSATSGNVRWEGAILPVVDASTNISSADFNTLSAVDVAVPGTLNQVAGFSLALATLTNLAASRLVLVYLARNGGHANDTAAGDAILDGLAFTYTA